IRKCSVAIILVQPIGWLRAFRVLCLETRAVDEENVKPSVVIVIEERGAAARGLQQKTVLALASESRLGPEARLAGHVHKLHSERKSPGELIEGENRQSAAKRANEIAPAPHHLFPRRDSACSATFRAF